MGDLALPIDRGTSERAAIVPGVMDGLREGPRVTEYVSKAAPVAGRYPSHRLLPGALAALLAETLCLLLCLLLTTPGDGEELVLERAQRRPTAEPERQE